MLINPQNLSLTLFVSVLISLAVTSVEAHDFAQPNRRDHDNLKRLIRKRSPQLGQLGLAGVGADPNNDNPSNPNGGDLGGGAVSSASASAQSVSASAAAVSISATSAAVSDSASNSASAVSVSASASLSASASASVASVSASSVSPTSKASATTPAAQQPTQPAAQTPDPNAAQNDNVSHSQVVVTQVNSVIAAAETNTPAPPPESAVAQKKSTITTVLIVIAASVGGAAILWTIFRKWKLGHSKKFDERMAPIDWQPTTDPGIIPAHRRTNSRASSFTSSAAHGNAGYSDRLEHDFTAAPSHLAPVGGYADLARGPSPQPQMQEAYGQGLARGPSTTRPAYDTGVPLHHQAGYGQAEAYDYNGDAIRF